MIGNENSASVEIKPQFWGVETNRLCATGLAVSKHVNLFNKKKREGKKKDEKKVFHIYCVLAYAWVLSFTLGQKKRHEKWKVRYNTSFMSTVNVHLHYSAVLGLQHDRSKSLMLPLLGIFSFQEGNLSLHPSYRRTAFDHIKSQNWMHYSAQHTHTHTHIPTHLHYSGQIDY